MSEPEVLLGVGQDDCVYCSSVDNIREVRPFHWLLLGVLAALYFATVATRTGGRTPGFLLPFTALMAAHAGLHWLGPYLSTRRRWLPLYLIGQGALVVAISALARSQLLAEGLFLALCGEAVGILEDVRLSSAVVSGYLFLSGLACAWLFGAAALPVWLLTTAPFGFFVAVYVAMFVRQAQARLRAQTLLGELEAAHRQLAAYADQVEDLTLAAERQRMARELHDTLSQGLSGVILQLEAADSYLGRGNTARGQAIVAQAMDRARAALAGARSAIDDLRATERVAGSLAEAVTAEVDRFIAATGIPCELDLALPGSMADPLCETAQRAVAEGLANVARHARASRAWVRLTQEGSSLDVLVRDDGAGFMPAETVRAGHYGLLGLRERARLAGGTMEIISAPGQGTVLRLRLPLAIPAPARAG